MGNVLSCLSCPERVDIRLTVPPPGPVPLPPPPPAPAPNRSSRPEVIPGTAIGSSTAASTPTTASRRPAAPSGDGSHRSTSRPSPVNRRPNRRTRSTLSVASSHRYPLAATTKVRNMTLSVCTITGIE